jgi:hypothetical protein
MGDPTLDGDDALDAAEDEAEAENRPAARIAPVRTPRSAPSAQERPSIVAAFRTSFRPIDLRGDLRSLPRLLMTRAFLIPLDLSGAIFVWWALTGGAVPGLLLQYAAYPFAVAPVFAVGFFAARAGYLLGSIVSVAATLFIIPLLVALDADSTAVGALAIQNAVYGSFFGAAAAWYRRFLNRANPNRSRPAPSTTSRRPDGKIPRKQSQRPMLARRR